MRERETVTETDTETETDTDTDTDTETDTEAEMDAYDGTAKRNWPSLPIRPKRFSCCCCNLGNHQGLLCTIWLR